MQYIDDAEFQLAIDLDAGARIASLKWRDLEFTVPFRGQVHTYGWYAMATAVMVGGQDSAKWFGQPELQGYQVFAVNRHEQTAWEI